MKKFLIACAAMLLMAFAANSARADNWSHNFHHPGHQYHHNYGHHHHHGHGRVAYGYRQPIVVAPGCGYGYGGYRTSYYGSPFYGNNYGYGYGRSGIAISIGF